MIPEISVITVVKDDSAGLTHSLNSLRTQTFLNWESLIISAPSEDETQSVADQIAESDFRITHHRENTPGIYQAMNQGIRLAQAPFVIFMNAGDIFAQPKAIEILYKEILYRDSPIVVGGYSTEQKVYTFKPRNFGPQSFSLNRRWGCHQSMIFNKHEVLSLDGFKEGLNLAADFELVLKLVTKKKGVRITELVSIVNPYGISNLQIRKTLAQKQEIRVAHFGRFSINVLLGTLWTYLVVFKICSRNFLRKVL